MDDQANSTYVYMSNETTPLPTSIDALLDTSLEDYLKRSEGMLFFISTLSVVTLLIMLVTAFIYRWRKMVGGRRKPYNIQVVSNNRCRRRSQTPHPNQIDVPPTVEEIETFEPVWATNQSRKRNRDRRDFLLRLQTFSF